MRIANDIETVDLALYLVKEKALIISDIHIGYEESLNEQGILLPRFQFKETYSRFENLLKKLKVDTIVVNGDLKHEFGTISRTEWRDALEILDLFKKYCKDIIIIKGNHDTVLEPIARQRNLETVNGAKIGEVYICHGDFIPDTLDFYSSKMVVIGHEHPAISIGTKIRKETYKCFLKGRYKDKILIVMPSFNLVTEGTNILREKLLSPFLQQSLGNFEAFIVSDKVYRFGKLKDIG